MKRLIDWSIFALVVSAAWLVAGPSTFGGPAAYVIVDGISMEPTYEDGDLVVAYERGTYEVGDVIVYDAPIDSQFNVIHRINERTEGGFVTQGDNRDEVDNWIAPDDEIYGAALFHIPNGGAIINLLRQPITILAIGAGWITLILMERSPKGPGRGGTRRNAFTGRQKPSQTTQRRRRSSTPVNTMEAPAPASRASRTEKKAAERRKKRSALATLGLAALGGVSGAVLFAHAASLNVNAGVLQTFQQQADFEPPPVPEHAITVYAHFFDNSSPGEEIGRSPFSFQSVLVKAGQSYQVTWNGPPGKSEVVDCTSDAIDFLDTLPAGTYQGIETILPEHDATHLLCIQTAPGNVPENITFETFNGDGVEVELTPSDDEGSDGTDHTGTEAQDVSGTDQDADGDDSAEDVTNDNTATEENFEGLDGGSDTPDETDENDTTGDGATGQDAPEEDLTDDADEEDDPDEAD